MSRFRFLLILVHFLFFSSRLFAQSETDSLRNFVTHAKNLEEKYQALLSLYESSYTSDPKTAEIYIQKAIEVAIQDKNLYNQGNAYNKFGLFYGTQYEFEKGLKQFKIAEDKFNELGDQEMVGVVYNNMGLNYGYQQELGKELTCHHKALAIFDEIKKPIRQAMSYVNIGNVYIQKNDFDKSISYYKKALPIYEELEDYKRLGTCLNNIALINFNQHKDELSYTYFKKTLKVYETLENKRGISMVLYNMASPLLRLKKYDEAKACLDRAESILLETGSEEGLAICYNNYGTLYAELGDYKEAERYYQLAIHGAKKTRNQLLELSCYKGLSELYSKIKNYEGAYTVYKMYAEINDSIKNNRIEQINEVEKQHIAEKNKKELELVNKEKKLQAYESKMTIITTIGIILILIILFFGLFKKYQTKKKSNALLEEKNALIEEKNKEITDSISYAKRIQSAILPPDNLFKECLKDSFVLYKPKDIVAGDFYWMEVINKDTISGLDPESHSNDKIPQQVREHDLILFAAADCTGHGVPGAMVSVICNNGLNRSVREFGLSDPGKILDKTRELVIQEFEKSEEEVKDGMDIALCCLNGTALTYAGAHNPLWIIRNDELIEIKADKQPIGQFDHPTPYISNTISLEKRDTIYIFSDGFVDQFGGDKGKKFKSAQLRELLLSIQSENMDRQKEILNQAFEKWKGKLDQVDDVCVIGVKI